MRPLILFLASLPAFGACASSWTNGYVFCREITIDHTKVPSNQTNFPMEFCIGSGVGANCSTNNKELATVANGGKLLNASGYDFIFTSDNAGTTPIAYEREDQDLTTGDAVMWVLVASVSSSVDTKIYLFYRNAGVSSDQSNATAVWDSNYKAVHHFSQLSGNVTSAPDSTSNGNTLFQEGLPGRVVGGLGQIGGSGVFVMDDGLANGSATGMPSGSSPRTMEIWIKPVVSGFVQMAYCLGNNSNNQRFGLWLADSPSTWAVEGVNVAASFPGGTSNAWHHFALTLPSGSTTFMGVLPYVDGALQTLSNLANWTNTVNTAVGDYRISFYCGIGSAALNTNTAVDEARVSDIARSTDWITTEYNNMSSPNTFYTLGAESGGTSGIGGPRPIIFR